MSHPKDDQLIPKGTKCIWTRPSHRVNPKVVKATIVKHCFQFHGKGFLNYEVEIENMPGKKFAAYHGDLKVIE